MTDTTRRNSTSVVAVAFALLASLHGAMAAARDGARDYVEVAYSLYNPDWERRENASGASLLASKALGAQFRLVAGINLLETDDTGLDVVSARGLPFRNWHTVGAAYGGDLGSQFGFTVTAAYEGVEVDGNYKSGASLSAGLTTLVFRNLELGVAVGWLDLVISDTTLVGHGTWRLTDRTHLTARIMDYAEWDYTRYEIGLRAGF